MKNNRIQHAHYRRATENARAATKAKARKTNILLSSAALLLVAVVIGSFIAFHTFSANSKAADTNPTTISAKADKNVNKAAQSDSQTTQQTAQPASVQVVDSSDNQQTAQSDNQQTYQDSSSQDSSSQSGGSQSTDSQDAQDDGSNIQIINGDRIYIDTKRPIPENSGTPYHYCVGGQTSYGFNWDYDADNGNFLLRCDYNLTQHQYDFQFYGLTPGTANVTLYYYTDDNTVVPVNLTINVDNDLNATAV